MDIANPSTRTTAAGILVCSLLPWCFNLTHAADTSHARWEPEILAFEATDKTNPPASHAVLFIGSSSIRYWTNIESAFPGHQVFRRGFGGSELSDAVAFADRILVKYRPHMVLVYAGDNDIANGKSPQCVLAEFKTFARKIHAALPGTVIGYIAIKPSLARRTLIERMKNANELIRNYIRQNSQNMVFVDVFNPMLDSAGAPQPGLFAPDGLHLNEKGYKLWASMIMPVLERFDAAPKQ